MLLDAIESPEALRRCSPADLRTLAEELRAETIRFVAETGGHLGAGLGVVELTVALHYVFNTPVDRLVWDVGHQAYPHKILTGRRNRMHTLRSGGGLSGFTKRSESEYDPFGAAHAATSVSAALGMATARDLSGRRHSVIAVIGDGSVSAGMAFEAINHAGSAGGRLIVILNDNGMSIAPAVGAVSAYLSRLTKSHAGSRAAGAEPPSRLGSLFEDLGFCYVGPIDGHDFDALLPVLTAARDSDDGPILIHAVTQKGKGYAPAESSSDKGHSVANFDIATGAQVKPAGKAPSYTKVFGESLVKEARKDERIVAVTAAMPSGTGLDIFARAFPDRAFDVGIAEQHAVTFAAGMATEGLKPFCAIYSTFLQRGYDQVVHDVALQSLPVRFAIDRAGLVGADGPTHAGSFDLAYLGCLPGFVIMAAADEADLAHMIATSVAINDRPSAFRYPRGEGTGVALPPAPEVLTLGKGRVLREGNNIAILSLGTRLGDALKAADELAARGFPTTVADARFAKPIDTALVEQLARNHEVLITIEEASIGGFSAQVLQHLAWKGLLDSGLKIRPMVMPDRFIDHDSQPRQLAAAGLSARDIVAVALSAMGIEAPGAGSAKVITSR